ncbi:MAG: hypothetical protein IPM75_14410 [Candidatus Competibacteraceae bacterium]|nr:hypothetical protein [Candidatus Competibacteraceae bacterium]
MNLPQARMMRTSGKEVSFGGHRGFSILPGGNYNTLSALASILLNRKEAGRDRYLAILDDHLSRERNPDVWKVLLYQLGNAGGSTPQGVSAFLRKLFGRFPEILATHEAVIFLGYVQRWDDLLVFDLISNWRNSDECSYNGPTANLSV